MSKKVLVTGGAGYIGSHTVVELITAGYIPVIVDDFRNSQPFILKQIEAITGQQPIAYAIDCQNKKELLNIVKQQGDIFGVIHFAADKAVGESVQEPIKYYQNNLGSLCTVLEVMKESSIHNLVFSSSCTVYGETQDPIVTENTPISEAASPYGDTKIIGERIIRFALQANQSLKATLLRYFNPIGAHPSALIGEIPQGTPNNLVPYITQTAKGIREKLTVFGDDYNTPDGTNIRDYIHVVDLAKAHVKALDFLSNQSTQVCEAFNLGTGNGVSVLEIIEAFQEVNDLKLNYEIGPRRPGDVVQIYANAKKANEQLNWKAGYSLREALKHAWSWELNLENINRETE